jgi:hypothetical protein
MITRLNQVMNQQLHYRAINHYSKQPGPELIISAIDFGPWLFKSRVLQTANALLYITELLKIFQVRRKL